MSDKVKLRADLRELVNSHIAYGQVNSSSTSTVFTATVPNVNQLVDGTTVMLRNGYVTSASGFTLNVNGLGAKPVYNSMADATADTTIFNINYTMLFVYDSTRIENGCWICYRGYNTNDNTIGYQIRTNNTVFTTTDKGYRYRIWLQTDEGKLMPVNTSTSTNATANRSSYMNTREFWLDGKIIYNSTKADYQADVTLPSNTMWQQYNFALGYSFNNTGKALTLTSGEPLYMVATDEGDGKGKLASPYYTQTLPSSVDNKLYIYLGHMTSAVNMELALEHPIFEYKNGGIRLYRDTYTTSEVDTLLNGKSDTGHTHTGYANSTHTHTKNQITDFPTLSTVATTGSYNDLSDKPNIPQGSTVDTTLSSSSNNAIANSTVKNALDNKLDKTHTSYKGKNVVTNSSTGAIEFEEKNNHTHSQYLTEHQSLSNYVTNSDSRLSDARTPLSHTHGNLQNNGQVGSTAQANKNVVTDSNGLITTEDKPTIPSASSTTPSADTTNGSVGTGTTWARSNHTHPKSSLYAESSHTHSQYLTEHQNISGKEDTSNKTSSWNTTTNNTRYPTEKLVKDSLDGKSDTGHTHSQYLTSHQDITGKLDKAQTSYKGKNVVVDSTSGEITFEDKNNHTHSNYLTSSDISGKIDTAGTGLSKNGTTLNHSNSVTALTTSSLKKIKYDSQGHIVESTDVSASDLPSHTHTQYTNPTIVTNTGGWNSSLSDEKVPSEKLVKNSLDNKVDKENGKGLFSGSYSDLTSKPSYTPTVTSSTTGSYEIGTININGSDVSIYGKDTNTEYTHPTYSNVAKSTSALYKIKTNSLGHIIEITEATSTDIANLGVEITDTVYTHPSYTSKSSGLYKITVDGTGHISGTASVSASDLPSHTHSQYLTSHQDISNYVQKSNTIGLIKNDGTIDTTSYSTFDGNYNNLTNKPTIPTQTSQLTNNNGFITSSSVPTIADNLTTNDSTQVLSAKQGKVLNTNKIETSAIATSFSSTTSDSKVPSEKLTKTELDKKITKSNSATGLLKDDGTVDTNTYLTTANASSTYVAKETGKGLFTGSYSDLSNKPSIPTDLSDLSDSNSLIPSIVTDSNGWNSTLSDDEVPSEKLVKSSLDDVTITDFGIDDSDLSNIELYIIIGNAPTTYILDENGTIDNSSTLFGDSVALRNSGSNTSSWNSSGYYTVKNTGSQKESMRVLAPLTGLTDNFCIEYDSYVEGSGGSSGFVIYNSSTAWEKLTDDADSNKKYWYGYNDGSFHESGFYGNIVTNQKWVHYKYTVSGSTFTMEVTYDNSNVVTHSETIHLTRNSTTKYGLDSEWQLNTITRYKNLKAYLI